MVVPASLREEVLSDLHEGSLGGHLGTDKTLGRLKERFYWPGHYNDVTEWCRNCATCAARKSPPVKPRAPLQPIVTSYPLQLVAMDIVGPFPESPAGNSYILVVADYFTRYTEAYPIPNQEAATVANKVVEEFFFRFSPPERLHSDQGQNFESAIVTEVFKLLGVEKSRTTPYHPQSDGLVEQFNRTLLDMLATAVRDRPFECEQYLRRLCLAYNTSVHPTTGFSPFYLMFGRQVRMPVDIMLGTATSHAHRIPEYVSNLRTSLETAYEYVRDRMGHKLEEQKARYDTKTCGKSFEAGDLVWLHNPVVPRGKSRKLHQPWTGPYKVVKKVAESVYGLQHTQRHRKRPVVHFNRLKSCSPDTRLPQVNKACPQPSDPPVGSGLELVNDPGPEVGAPESVSAPERPTEPPDHASFEMETSLPGTVQPSGEQPTSPPSAASSGCDVGPPPLPTSEPPQPPFQLDPPRHRYPQRDRSAPVRLYGAVV